MHPRCLVVSIALALVTGPAARCLAAKTMLPEPVIPDALGVNIHFKEECQDLDLIAEAGWRFIRMDHWWSAVEAKKGAYDFDRPGYDALTQGCRRRGIRLLYILCYDNRLYTRTRAVRTDEARNAFAAFAAAAARHHRGRGIIWEIWNEPNIKNFWKPEPRVEDYMALVKATVPRMRQADPDAFICAPATSGIPLPWLEDCFKRGLLDLVDAVSVHPYRSQVPETVVQDYERVRRLIRQHASSGKEVPLISSEWGYSNINWDKKRLSEEQQAARMIRQWLVNLDQDIRISIWYDWKDDGTDPANREHHFGTVYPDLQPKPAYRAAKVFMVILKGYRVAGRIDLGSENDWALRLASGPRQAVAVWTTGPPHTVRLGVSAGRGTLVRMLGQKKPVSWEGRALELDVNGHPQYLILD